MLVPALSLSRQIRKASYLGLVLLYSVKAPVSLLSASLEVKLDILLQS